MLEKAIWRWERKRIHSKIKQKIAQGGSRVAQRQFGLVGACAYQDSPFIGLREDSQEILNIRIIKQEILHSLWMSTHQVKSILATQISFLLPGSIRGIKSSPCWPMSMLMTVVSAGSLQMEVVLFFLMNASSHRFYGIAQYPYCHQLCLSCKSVFPLWLLLPSLPPTNSNHSAQELGGLLLQPGVWAVSTQLYVMEMNRQNRGIFQHRREKSKMVLEKGRPCPEL